MNDKVMYVTGVIDTELWNKASWMGTAILSNKKSAPYLGLLFQNRDAAIKIFEQWNKDFGHRDLYEEIRIAVIEGDIPGKEHGYTIHITTNQENLIAKCRKLNVMFLSYKIIPIYMSENGLEPLFDYEIEKTEIFFRQADEITENDIDVACVK